MPQRSAVAFDEGKIDAIFAGIDQCHLPGAAVGIAIGGRPAYRRGFGLASMELPVVLSPSIRMRIHSTTKHFTCLAYMLLCEEGRASIDDPIRKYLPEIHPVTQAVTARQLMGNIGGLRDACDIRWLFSGTRQPIPSTELLSLYRDIDDVNFAPGMGWCYNNGGFQLLSAAIERISGRTFEEVLRERVLDPVGMHDTLVRRLETDFVPNSATMHMTALAGRYEKSYLPGETVGEGGLVSTVDDMLRWLAYWERPQVGNAATWALMKAPQILANGTSTGYGLGLMSGRYRGVEIIFHPGGGRGGNSQMLKVPAAGLDVVVIANRHDVSAEDLVDRILDACLPGLDLASEARSQPHAIGTFRSPTTGRVIELGLATGHPRIKEGQLMASMDGLDMPVAADEDGALRPAGTTFGNMKYSIAVTRDEEIPAAIRFSDFGNVDELVHVEPIDNPDVGAIAGRYRSDSTGTEATIFDTDRGARMKTIGRFGSAEFQLECLAQGSWRARSIGPLFPYGGILSFRRNETFRFSSFCTQALPFRRIA